MKSFFDKFENLNGAKFIGIKNYSNKYGEVANINLLANISVLNAKQSDLQTLKNVTDKDIIFISNDKNLDVTTLKIALSELIASAEKNLSKDLSERTNQSKAQTESYLSLCPSVRLHKDSLNVFVSGFINSKTILVEGTYPTKNKRDKTLCKDAIGKFCKLKMLKFRQYNIGEMNSINITGSTLQM